ncbi:methanol:corrinoid methyltransferase [Methanosarcina thermophila]|jgi:methanol--5-hydroxybenzimidazolylcobamide Co-methyltransferase|uniref:Methanol:corrinoid methyltransferase n=3 Tax=Methanosarcina thermophila TaxID=2210 RepID=A0A1I7A7T7_METTE|nr:methanol--corrinoid protein co-methyltransferase MtaB [Methanosarcina thermophila]ALK05564.1 MAG: methanol-5-hydroxybenzimidazolylcobamide methyltransferase [Methanosarcina sp. 795]AKB11841.1 Methanol:corrinoid methyltransferase [Methanosarcina thermophila TM-1]AKB14965.1 Methanol:corrinoid methyltransferase [Methanosarcina thermophila CHTI-55]NLU56789.1 methanol--corrinoid methyltransferase [Methanosarcina thermophila]SFT71013.1 methanol:corrinoid methyltransferase [Methanosarcina thermoph
MAVTRCTKMAYSSADEMVFGRAVNPVKAGLGLEIGAGYTTPEVNYAPRPEAGVSKEKLVKEYERITTDIMARMVQIGAPAVVLETEHVQQMSNNPDWGAEVAHAQKTIMEDYHDEYGIKCALRHTIGDIRESRDFLELRGDKYSVFMEAFEQCAENGADMLAVESMGGKEVFDYAILRNDMAGVLYGIGVLGSMDMEMIWQDIASIAKKNNVVASGDTDCAQANTAMFIAGGLLDKNLAHTLAIIARAVSAARSLVAYEAGAVGPGKDCGYENTICKAIAGVPISQEGKTSTCAHSDLMGNLTMQCCDLWSNESVEYHGEFGGTTVQCWAETLAYDCALMNVALQSGNEKILRDMFVASDMNRDAQGYVLAYNNAYRIGEAITRNGDDIYLRAKNAAIECINIIEEGAKKNLELSRFESKALSDAKAALESLTDDKEQFMSDCLTKYKQEIKVFKPENYGL